MNLVKQTEQYHLEYSKNDWETSGTVFNNADGSISMTCSVKEEDLNIGSFTYNQPKEAKVSVTFEFDAANTYKFAPYALEVISEVLNNINE